MKRIHKLLSLILTICIAMSMQTGFAPTNAVADTTATGSEVFELPDIVDSVEAKENDYVGRVEAEEKDLYTFVFANGDGTNTMRIYSHPVKYVADDGSIRDISLDIEAKRGGGFVTADHEIVTTFESKLTDGITLEYNDVEIMLVPALGLGTMPTAELSNDGKVVTYEMNDITSFVYELTYAGFKEDIVVEEYTGQTEYEFTLFTNGLTLCEEYGSYYLADAEGNVEATIGDIIVFTADERNNAMGSMTYETVRANQEYVLTIHLDADYLADEDTVYPIRIDPTIEINYDNNGAGAIEDVTINSLQGTNGLSGSLYIGRREDYGLSRVLMRFPNLSLSGISANQITAATVEIRDLMCQGDEDITVECRIYNKTSPDWSEAETTTWSSVGTSYAGTLLDSHVISYGQGNVGNHRYSFNILTAAKAWANGTQSPAKGLVFKANSTFENQIDDAIKTWYKTFSSYNRAEDYRPSLSLSYTISTDAAEISTGDIVSVSVPTAGATTIFRFVPTNTGFYTFESSNIVNSDPKAWLYNSSFEQLAESDGVNGSNFRLTYHLVEGDTYYFAAGCYGSRTGNYSVQLFDTLLSSYVSANSISSGASVNVSCTTSHKVVIYKFTPTQSAEYLLYTVKNGGDPRVWLYDSNLGFLTSNDDDAGSYNARLVWNFVAGRTYYIVAGEFGSRTGAYELNLLKSVSVSSAKCYLRNIGTLKYMDIDGPGAQEFVHQWTSHTGLQERWTIQKQSDGYYTIRSEYGNKYYVGVSNSSTGVNNIKLYSSISNSTKWKIFELGSDYVILEPKTAPGKVLYAPNTETGVELQLSLMGASVSNRNQWKLLNIGTYFSQVYNYFDDGYSVYYNESNSASRSLINGYMDDIANRYYQLLGLTLLYDSASYYESPIDICKGTVTSSNISTLCSHSGTVHTERGNVISSFRNTFSGGDTMTNILWSCHAITSTATNGDINYNRSCSSGDAIILIKRINSSIRARYSKGVLMHELNHQYGAKDHYHELADKDDPNSCKFKERCSECGSNPRPSTCIMNKSTIDISNSNVLCSACRNDMLSHLNGHHKN